MPTAPADKSGRDLVKRRHPEWAEHCLQWRWLLDSLEGGERYRRAIYGTDTRGLPIRNLVRHKREYPDPRETNTLYGGTYGTADPTGADPTYSATDDDFELRRARTPVPTFVKEAITDHLDRVYAREVKREGPQDLLDWQDDVDGKGSDIDCWLHRTVGPLLLVTGQLDVLCDHPQAPEGEAVNTQNDVIRLNLGRCVASYILPENMLWWRLLPNGKYAECLVQEFPDGEEPEAATTPLSPARARARYRHWTATESTLYDADGKLLSTTPHAFKRVPIVRLFAARKARCGNVGQSDYEGVADRMREYYNRDSELILSDTTQAHPLLQGPEDFVQADGTIPIGPSWLLPKKKNTQGGNASYEGFEVVNFPKDGAESIRLNKADLRDQIDRDAALTKPAGSSSAGGKGANVTAQSGLSKSYDNERLTNKLAGVASTLQEAEMGLAELALTVLNDGPPKPAVLDSITIEYSHQFDLATGEDLRASIAGVLEVAASPAAGRLQVVTGEYLKAIVRRDMPGRDDDTYAEWDAEIDAALKLAATAAAVAAPAEKLLPSHATAVAAPTSPTPLNAGPTPSREPVSLGDLHDAISAFDKHAPVLKGLLNATKG